MLVFKIMPSLAPHALVAVAALALTAATTGCSTTHHQAIGQDNGSLTANLDVATSYGSVPARHGDMLPQPSAEQINHHDVAPAAR